MIEETPVKERAQKNESTGAGSSSPLDGFSYEPHRRQFQAIAEAIKNNEIPPVSGEDSLRSLAIVLGVYTSAKMNKVIYVES